MADLVIRGMEMPRTCQICRTARFDRIVGCEEWDRLSVPQRMYKRSETCPLFPLPEGHGRIGDLDALKADIEEFIEFMTKAGAVVDGEMLWGKLLDALDNAKTIVPAEGGTDDEHV